MSDFLNRVTEELYAVLMAIEWVKQSQSSKILICSDSKSVLQGIKSDLSTNHQELINKIINHSNIVTQGKEIVFIWIPVHIGISGNEKVDRLAKQATEKEEVDIDIKLSK